MTGFSGVGADGEAAIYYELGACDPGGAWAGEEGYSRGYVCGETPAAEGVEGLGVVGEALRVGGRSEPFFPEGGVDIAGADGVDADAAGG